MPTSEPRPHSESRKVILIEHKLSTLNKIKVSWQTVNKFDTTISVIKVKSKIYKLKKYIKSISDSIYSH